MGDLKEKYLQLWGRLTKRQHYMAIGGVVVLVIAIVAASFAFGGAETVPEGYFITNACIGCKLCYSKCPQKCIDISVKPVVIAQTHCLHCGNCFEICPARAVIKQR